MTTPGRAELVAALQRLVDTSGLDSGDIAARMGVSPSTLYRYLHGRTTPTAAAVAKVIAATGQDGTDTAREALQIAEDLPAGNAGRVVLLRPGSATSQRRWHEEAQQATAVAEYALTMPCGLLQTRRYMRGIFTSGGQSGEGLAASVGARMASQELLDDPDHRFTLLMPEGVLRWPALSAEVMREQLAHIAEMARRDTGGRVRIGVIPSWRPVDVFPMTNFTIYDDRLVVIGTDFGTAFLDRRPDVAFYSHQLDLLAAFAQWDADAAVECERIAADYAG